MTLPECVFLANSIAGFLSLSKDLKNNLDDFVSFFFCAIRNYYSQKMGTLIYGFTSKKLNYWLVQNLSDHSNDKLLAPSDFVLVMQSSSYIPAITLLCTIVITVIKINKNNGQTYTNQTSKFELSFKTIQADKNVNVLKCFLNLSVKWQSF